MFVHFQRKYDFLFWQILKIKGILLTKLFLPTVRKKCSNDQEKLLKFEAEGQEFAQILRSLEQFVRTVKGQNNFWSTKKLATMIRFSEDRENTHFSKNYHDITDKVAEVCLLSANGTEPSFEVTFKFTQF